MTPKIAGFSGKKVSLTILESIPVDDIVTNQAKINEWRARLKDYNKRTKKDAFLTTQTVDDSLVMSLDVNHSSYAQLIHIRIVKA